MSRKHNKNTDSNDSNEPTSKAESALKALQTKLLSKNTKDPAASLRKGFSGLKGFLYDGALKLEDVLSRLEAVAATEAMKNALFEAAGDYETYAAERIKAEAGASGETEATGWRRYLPLWGRITIGGKPYMVNLVEPTSSSALQKKQDFIENHAHDYSVDYDDNGEERRILHAAIFATKGARDAQRFPKGLVFDPSGDAATKNPGALNVYRGMRIEPSETGSCDLFRRLIHEVWCGGDEALSEWVWEYFLHLVGRPWSRSGTSIAIRGDYGIGKSIVFADLMRKILGDMILIVANEKEVLGDFNIAVAYRRQVVLEEAAFAGDQKLFSALKNMITSSRIRVNEKHITAFEIDSYAELCIVSNEPHFLHVLGGDRRYTVLSGDAAAAQRWKEQDLYTKMLAEWNAGGAAHFLYLAQNHTFRTQPGSDRLAIQESYKTEALAEQVSQSRNPMVSAIVKFMIEGKLEWVPGFGKEPRIIKWDDVSTCEPDVHLLSEGLAAVMADLDKRKASHYRSSQAMISGFASVGIEACTQRVGRGSARITVRVLPPRLKALETALAMGAITLNEWHLGSDGLSYADAMLVEKLRASEAEMRALATQAEQASVRKACAEKAQKKEAKAENEKGYSKSSEPIRRYLDASVKMEDLQDYAFAEEQIKALTEINVGLPAKIRAETIKRNQTEVGYLYVQHEDKIKEMQKRLSTIDQDIADYEIQLHSWDTEDQKYEMLWFDSVAAPQRETAVH